jgi:hypothetical protein
VHPGTPDAQRDQPRLLRNDADGMIGIGNFGLILLKQIEVDLRDRADALFSAPPKEQPNMHKSIAHCIRRISACVQNREMFLQEFLH